MNIDGSGELRELPSRARVRQPTGPNSNGVSKPRCEEKTRTTNVVGDASSFFEYFRFPVLR
jgi:hypothetical protein